MQAGYSGRSIPRGRARSSGRSVAGRRRSLPPRARARAVIVPIARAPTSPGEDPSSDLDAPIPRWARGSRL